MRRHVIVGFIAAVLLLLVYTGVITVAQGIAHAVEQAGKLWYWIAALAAGFGVQAGLFSFIRQSLRERRTSSTTASVAASGSISAGSMVACCAHHLGDILPIVGLSGLTAFLVSYQTFFIVIGVVSNVVGIVIMLETIQRLGLCPYVARWPWDMGKVKTVTIALALFITASVFVLTS